MSEFDELKHGVADECHEDVVGLWSVVWDVHHRMPKASERERRDIALRIISDLLTTNQIWAGHPTGDGRGFIYWDVGPTDAMKRINDEWDRLGHEPNVGEVVWFTAKQKQAA
jgi:hypothetical protein